MKKFMTLMLAFAMTISALGALAEADGKITIWTWDPTFNIKAMQIAKEMYQKDHPDVEIDIQEKLSEDIETAVIASNGDTSTLPDILLVQDNSFQKFVTNYPEVYADLTGKYDYEGFAQGKLAYSIVDGKNHGIPFDAGTAVAAYRTDYLEAAGYTVADGKITAAPAGGRMDAEVMVGGSGKGDHPSFMALTLASDALKEIGFNLIVSDMSNFAEMTNAINAGTADMFAMAWQATPDPDMFQIYHSKGGSNEKSYWIKDADLDELIMMARQSTDQTYRKTLYKQCLDIVADWAVEIPIYQRQNCVIFSAKRVNLDTVTPDITTYWAWYNDIELLDLQ